VRTRDTSPLNPGSTLKSTLSIIHDPSGRAQARTGISNGVIRNGVSRGYNTAPKYQNPVRVLLSTRGIRRFTRRTVVRSSRKSFRAARPGVPHAEIARTLFQIRERQALGFPACGEARVPAFFGWNARNRLISRRRSKEKRKKAKGRRKKMDERMDERASERTNERTNERTDERTNEGSGGSCCGGGRKERKKDTRQSAAFALARFSVRLVLFAVLPASSLFPAAIGLLRNGRIKGR